VNQASIPASKSLKKGEAKSKARELHSEVKAEKPSESTMEFISSMSAVLVTGLFIITFIVQAFEIPSKSMVTTLLVGDHLFVDRERYAPPTSWTERLMPYRQIHRGDIVVFLSPAQPGLYLVKRIRGVPGDHLRLDKGRLYINGQLQDEPFVTRSGFNGAYVPYRDDFPSVAPTEFDGVTQEWRMTMPFYVKNGELVIPPDRYFAMGDNRDNSFDSRYWGFLPRENVIGTPLFIYWSFETPEDEYQKTSMGDRAQFILHVLVHFFDQTRWRRMFHMVR
jgi:signal peptidase I